MQGLDPAERADIVSKVCKILAKYPDSDNIEVKRRMIEEWGRSTHSTLIGEARIKAKEMIESAARLKTQSKTIFDLVKSKKDRPVVVERGDKVPRGKELVANHGLKANTDELSKLVN